MPATPAALRESISKATLEEPTAVIVNVSELRVPAESAWSAFIGAHWQLAPRPKFRSCWSARIATTREAITRSEVAHFMPVYSTEKGGDEGARPAHPSAPSGVPMPQLPANLTSLRESRRLVREWLTEWSQSGAHPGRAGGRQRVRGKRAGTHRKRPDDADRDRRRDSDHRGVRQQHTPAVRLPSPEKGIDVSGLAIVAALSRAWGSTPTSSGKTVWAVIGPENQL